MDLIDISHHNSITGWDQVPTVPIVHKVNEGTAIDRQVRARLPRIAERTEVFGGYTVLIVSASSIRRQLEIYADVMEPYWRDGAFTQLDIEPWDRYPRPVSTEEIVEAGAVHDEIFGPGRFAAYINPNQLPRQFAELDRAGWLTGRLWLPDYSADGAEQAERRGAVIHQYTSSARVPGFVAGIDANRVLDRAALERLTNLQEDPMTGISIEHVDTVLVDTRTNDRPLQPGRPLVVKTPLLDGVGDAVLNVQVLSIDGLGWLEINGRSVAALQPGRVTVDPSLPGSDSLKITAHGTSCHVKISARKLTRSGSLR